MCTRENSGVIFYPFISFLIRSMLNVSSSINKGGSKGWMIEIMRELFTDFISSFAILNSSPISFLVMFGEDIFPAGIGEDNS